MAIHKGDFVDTYRGEVITNAEADRREAASGPGKDSYLFALDKFHAESEVLELYVVDGQFKGGPTRFINHSCDPNLRQFAVMRHRGNPMVYDMAFFAVRDIPAYAELNFDYLDRDEEEDDEDDEDGDWEGGGLSRGGVRGGRGERQECRCGADNCRGFLWKTEDNGSVA